MDGEKILIYIGKGDNANPSIFSSPIVGKGRQDSLGPTAAQITDH